MYINSPNFKHNLLLQFWALSLNSPQVADQMMCVLSLICKHVEKHYINILFHFYSFLYLHKVLTLLVKVLSIFCPLKLGMEWLLIWRKFKMIDCISICCSPQVTIATAVIFCHRFFIRQSHSKNDRRVSYACIFFNQ